MKLGILNDLNGNYKKYIDACEDLGIEYEVIDIVHSDWVENIKQSNVDGILVRPQVNKQVYKDMYDERLYFIEHYLKIPMFPTFNECFIYEDKKRMSYFLKMHDLAHAQTHVFYDKEEAFKYIEEAKYPLVFKTNNGSGAIGVRYVKNKREAEKLIKKVFTSFRFLNFGYTKWKTSRWKVKYPMLDDRQFNYIIFQEKVNVRKEWRIIKLGNSYFGHQKLSDGKFHSGSLKVGWKKPPLKLLELVREISDEHNFNSMSFDIFETKDGSFLINELQTIFGSYNDSQMYINGVPGRYIYSNKQWKFEKGYFNTNASFDLRVATFIDLLKENKDEKII